MRNKEAIPTYIPKEFNDLFSTAPLMEKKKSLCEVVKDTKKIYLVGMYGHESSEVFLVFEDEVKAKEAVAQVKREISIFDDLENKINKHILEDVTEDQCDYFTQMFKESYINKEFIEDNYDLTLLSDIMCAFLVTGCSNWEFQQYMFYKERREEHCSFFIEEKVVWGGR